MDWYQPQGDAERVQLEKEFENIGMQGDEDPKLLIPRAEGKLNVLSALGIRKSDHEVTRILTRRLPAEYYDAEQRNSLLRPGITRSEMEAIARTSHANRKTMELEERNLAAVASMAPAPLVDPHALAIGGGFQGRYGGGGPQQQQQRSYGQQQLQQQQRRQYEQQQQPQRSFEQQQPQQQQQRQYGGAARQLQQQQQRQLGGGRQQQRGDGSHRYQQPHPPHPQQLQQQPQRPRGAGGAGNTERGWYQPEAPPPPGASIGRNVQVRPVWPFRA